jgi:hypothetical protein
MRNGSLRTLAMLVMVGSAVSVTGGTSLASTPVAGAAKSYLRKGQLAVELNCDTYISSGVFCFAHVLGGTEPYSYSWIGGQPSEFSPAAVHIECSPGQYAYAEVLVTDSNGSTGGDWSSFQC